MFRTPLFRSAALAVAVSLSLGAPSAFADNAPAASATTAAVQRQAVAKGLDIGAAVQSVGLSERERWALFDEYHGRNVTKAFKELEWE